MSVRNRLAGVLLALICLSIVTAVAVNFSLSRSAGSLASIERHTDEVGNSVLPLLLRSKAIKADIVQIQQWLTDISATRGRDGLNDGLDKAAEYHDRFYADVAAAQDLAEALDETLFLASLSAVEAAMPAYYEIGREMAQAYIDQGPDGGNAMMADFDAAAETMGAAAEAMTRSVELLANQRLRSLAEESHAVGAANDEALLVTLAITLVAVALALAGGIYLFRLVGNSLSGLQHDITSIAERRFDSALTLDADRRDEFGVVARALTGFRDSLAEMDQLAAEREEMDRRAQSEKQALLQQTADRFEATVVAATDQLTAAAKSLQGTADGMSSVAERTSQQSDSAAEAADTAAENVRSVAAAAEQLRASIEEIRRQVGTSTEVAGAAASEAEGTNRTMAELSAAAQQIGDVVQLIADIAEQTNLLALNATIEAARAGEMGKGFAVVASEVKNLANQTAKATDEIAQKVGEMQSISGSAVDAIGSIRETIGRMGEIATTISASMDEQAGATQEISSSVQRAADGTGQVTTTVRDMSGSARDTGEAAGAVTDAAGKLLGEAETLRGDLGQLLREIRA